MNQVRLGIIGCGGMSRYHGKFLTAHVPGAAIVAVCDTHPENLQLYQREVFDPVQQKPRSFADYRAMLQSVPMDGVLIVTPHAYHFEQTMAALDAGCHVLLEKPMVIRVDHARQLIDHALHKKLIVSLAFPGPFSADFAYIRGLLDSGAMGVIHHIDAFVTQNWRPQTVNTWRQEPALSGGGQAYDSGAHMFNAVLYLTNLRPIEVFAWCDNRGTPVDINTVATIRFDNGALATASVGGDSVPGMDSHVIISGSQSLVRVAAHGGPVKHWDASGQEVCNPPLPAAVSLQQNFVDCIQGRATTPCPPIWGLRQALLMEALYQSARSGQPAKVASE